MVSWVEATPVDMVRKLDEADFRARRMMDFADDVAT